MSKLLVLSILLAVSPLVASGQLGGDSQQTGSASGQSNDANCQDSGSATCLPQGANQGGDFGASQLGAQGQQGGYQGGQADANASTLGRTGNQPFTTPQYSDQNALPNQSRLRQGYTPVPAEPLTEFQKFTAETTGQVLPIFGARLFSQVPTTFSPVDQIPVPADAAIGPGDLLRVRIWGQVNFSADLRVDRSGEIYLPQVGPVHVAGLQYADLDKQLHTAIGRVYRNFNVSAQVGQVRAIQVYVVGRARRPGTYTVSSLSSLIDALFASGGPSLEGSLRHIQLKREGKTVVDLDLYDLLLNGDKSGDARLQPGDVIYIPAVGPQVAVLGSVKTPAIYEERGEQTIGQVLEQAAGTTSIGSASLIVEQLQGHDGRAAQKVALTTAGLATPVKDGDILRVQPAVPRYDKTITLRGNTVNPGRYSWHAGMRLSELFPDRAALLTRNYWWQRTRLGLPGPEFERVPSLERLVQPNHPLTLPITPQDRDRVEQLERQRQNYQEQLRSDQLAAQATNSAAPSLTGQQQAPGQLGVAQGAGSIAGTQNGINAQSYDPYDQNPTSELPSTGNQIGPDGTRLTLEGDVETATLARRDVATENTANATGLNRVTLPAPPIDWSYAVIERLDPETLKTSLVPFDLGRLILNHDASQDLELQPGDIVTVFSEADIHVPMEQQTRLIRLEGEFVHAGVYSVKQGETLRDVVNRAGGLSPGAYLFGSEFNRASVRAVQQRRLDEYVQNLQLQIERGVLATASAAGSSAADLAGASTASTEARELVARLEKVKATGRIVLNIRAYDDSTESLPAISLEDGDSFYVPSTPSNVSVIGSVYNQSTFLYKPGDHVKNYLHLAGGANRDADKHHPFVIRADGSVISMDLVGEKKFDQIIIQPGDTIVISEKTFGPTKLRNFLNFSQLFSQLAIGAAVLTVL